MDATSDLDVLLDLMRRLPPQRTEENLAQLVDLCPDIADDLLSSVDQPLKIRTDCSGRDYLACDYNRDGDSYRSPWTNTYEPELPDGTTPTPKLRKLEVTANAAFKTYREMYFETGVSSVYLWDVEDDFAGVILMKKVLNDVDALQGSWDSIHVFETSERGRNAHYKLTSTVMLHMVRQSDQLGSLSLAGSMTRQEEKTLPLATTSTSSTPSTSRTPSTSHIPNLGRLVEDMELKMRNLLQEVYFGKTRDVCNDLRSLEGLGEGKRRAGVQKELVGFLRGKATANAAGTPTSAPVAA